MAPFFKLIYGVRIVVRFLFTLCYRERVVKNLITAII